MPAEIPTLKSAVADMGDFFFKWRNQAFPLILLGIFVLAPPSDRLAGRESLEPFRDGLAALFVIAGLALRAWVIGFAYIKRGGVGKKVYAADLVTSGLFGVCRNPLYVGNLLIVAGVLVMHGNLFVILGGGLLMGFIYQSIVYAEERFLAAKFGAGYEAYCADVPRWRFALSRLRSATEGMRFDLKKAIVADYATVATSVAILAVTEIYEQLSHPRDPSTSMVISAMVSLIAAMAIWTLALRLYKKSPRRLAAPGSADLWRIRPERRSRR